MQKCVFLMFVVSLVSLMTNYASSQVQVMDEDNRSFFGTKDEAEQKYDCCTKVIRRGLKDFPASINVLLSSESEIGEQKCTVCVGARIQHDGKNIGFFRTKAEHPLEEKIPPAECRKKALLVASQKMVQTIKQFLEIVGSDFSKQSQKFDLLAGSNITVQASTGTVLSREVHLKILEKLQVNPKLTIEILKKIRFRGDLKIKATQSTEPQGWTVVAILEYIGTYGETNLDAEVSTEASGLTETEARERAVEKILDLMEKEILLIIQT